MPDFKAKMHHIRPPDLLAVFNGAYHYGEGKGRGRGGDENEREGNLPDQYQTASYARALARKVHLAS